jgi:hypothetical protein
MNERSRPEGDALRARHDGRFVRAHPVRTCPRRERPVSTHALGEA